MKYDKVAWKCRADAAKKVEDARKLGNAEQVTAALENYWRVCDEAPLYPIAASAA